MDEETTTQTTPETEGQQEDRDRQGGLARLADYGQETIKKAAGDLGHAAAENERVAGARDKLGEAAQSLLTQLHLATTDEVEELRQQVAALEERLAALETKRRSTAVKEDRNDSPEG
jgi:hypothetical protein